MRATTKTMLIAAAFAWGAGAAAAGLPDPTEPLEPASPRRPAAAPRPATPVLQSTLISATRRSAIISGERVHVGDKFQGAVVTDITAYEVRLSRGGREFSLRLHPKLKEQTGGVE